MLSSVDKGHAILFLKKISLNSIIGNFHLTQLRHFVYKDKYSLTIIYIHPIIDPICITLFFQLKKLKRRIFNARFQNIPFRGTGPKYFMVWVFSRYINRNQSFFSRCVDIPLFFILVINTERVQRRFEIESTPCE